MKLSRAVGWQKKCFAYVPVYLNDTEQWVIWEKYILRKTWYGGWRRFQINP